MSHLIDKLFTYPNWIIRSILLILSLGLGLFLYPALLNDSLLKLDGLKKNHQLIISQFEWLNKNTQNIQKAKQNLNQLKQKFTDLDEEFGLAQTHPPQKQFVELTQRHSITLNRFESPDAEHSNPIAIMSEVSGPVSSVLIFFKEFLALKQLIIIKQINLKQLADPSDHLQLSLSFEHYLDLSKVDDNAVQ